MSTHIKAFIPDTDPEYIKHKKIFMLCREMKVSLPKETAEYFNVKIPENWALEEKLEISLREGLHYTKWSDDMEEGFEVDINSLPSGVTKLRFFNSY